jgi:glycosyltransferase involved in cell wall biosynthesis
MTSLVLTHYRPHKPASGAPLRNWQNIRALATFGPVDVVTVGVEDTSEAIDGVREWVPFSLADRSTWNRIKTACSPVRPGIYPGIDLYYSTHVKKWLRGRSSSRPYEVAVIETIALAAYLSDLKRAARRVVFDAHNIEGVLQPALDAGVSDDEARMAQTVKQWLLARRLVSAERRVITGADLVWACSDHDAHQIDQRYGRQAGVTVVPNGVDLAAYRRADAPPLDPDWSRLPVTLVYPGLFSYRPNEDAALRLIGDVVPAVRALGFQARAVLVGRNPTPAMIDAARRDPAVQVTGAVESVVPYLEQPCVVTLPITLGSGTRLKIVEAFAAGRPVVTTAKGVEGIDAVDGTHLLVREDPQAIASAVIELWTRPEMRVPLCTTAFELARDKYSWSAAADRIAASLGLDQRREPSSVTSEITRRNHIAASSPSCQMERDVNG